VAKAYFHAPSGFAAIDVGGIPRILNRLLPQKAQRAAMASFADSSSVIPRADWTAIDRRATLPTLIDQKSHGSCVGFGSTGALMSARVLAGMPLQVLSGAYVYSWINGGSDQGAIIGDSVDALMKHGTCLESTVGWDTIYRNQASKGDTEAQRFKLFESYTINSFDEGVSALQLGFTLVFAVMVGNSFTDLDSDGCCGYDNGPGNHCVHADGVRKTSSGEWVLDMKNSWGPSFGDNGRGGIRQKLFEGLSSNGQDAYAIRAATTDPNDPTP